MPLSNGLSITQHPISSLRRSCRSLALSVPSRCRSGCFHGSPSPACRYRSTPATGPRLDSAVAKRSIIPDEVASSRRDGIPLRRIRIVRRDLTFPRSPDWRPRRQRRGLSWSLAGEMVQQVVRRSLQSRSALGAD
jgi:hypothetical protein